MKECIRCKQSKDFKEFFKDNSRKDKLAVYCKNCFRGINREKRLRYHTSFVKKDARYYAKNREKILAKRKDWWKANKHKSYAHEQVKKALYHGILVKEDCRECGNSNTVAHHPDYSKPLEVIWLCQKHHMILHHGKYHLHSDS